MKTTPLLFDHAYTLDKNHRFLKSLVKLGFTLAKNTVEHPGGAICRFVHFNDGSEDKRGYLEFVHLRGRTGVYKPAGFSFRVKKDLEKFFGTMKADKRLKATFDHKNYNWKENSKDRLPGWNFISLGATPKNIFVWMTEYEKLANGKKRVRKKAKHKNGARLVVGAQFDLSPSDWKFFERLFKEKLDQSFTLANGLRMEFRRAARTRFASMVVAVPNLDKLNQGKHRLGLGVFLGAPALKIQNPNPRMWDILLVQE